MPARRAAPVAAPLRPPHLRRGVAHGVLGALLPQVQVRTPHWMEEVVVGDDIVLKVRGYTGSVFFTETTTAKKNLA